MTIIKKVIFSAILAIISEATLAITTTDIMTVVNTILLDDEPFTYVPIATTAAATNIAATSATLNGTVNDNGGVTTVTFEFGLTTAYDTVVTATPTTIAAGTGNKTVTANKTGLTCGGIRYNYRIKAVNSVGTTNGINQTFKTAVCPPQAPTVTTDAATNVATHSATLNGQVNGGGMATTVTFDLGTSLAYGISIPATPTGFSGDSPVTANKTGLSCNTLYHYRTKAVNSKGEVFGGDQIFTTGLICAETPSVRLNPPAPIVKINRQFNLDVLVNTNGLKLGAYNFTIGFDQTKVVVDKIYQDQSGQCIQGVCPGIDMPAPTNVITDNDNGIVQVVGLSVTGLGPSNDLPLLAMHLQARNTTGDSPMSLTINELVTATQPATTIGDGAAAGATVKVTNYDCGDADGNGLVNIVDALAVARNVIGLPPPPTVGPAADVNGDGQIKIVDAMNIARYAVGLLVVDTCFEQ